MLEVNDALTRRSVLCVPAGDDRKVHKALRSGADEVVIDLEDAVAFEDKSRARAQLADLQWPVAHPRTSVRVNAAGTPWCHRDLEVVVDIPQVSSVVLPKVESRADVGFAERLLDGLESEACRSAALSVQALVESAAGIVAIADIVRAPVRLEALILGYADLAASIGRGRDVPSSIWGGVQDSVVLHARAAGIAAIDGPFLGVGDGEEFHAAVDVAKQRGFDAKWVIHPRQVAGVNHRFTPSEEQLEYAKRVLQALESAAAVGRGAAAVDGALVDEAMARDARRVLAMAVAR